MNFGNAPGMGRCRSTRYVREIGLLLLAMSLNPTYAGAQLEVSAGMLVVPRPSVGGTRVGVVASAAAARGLLGVPLLLETSIARTDFSSLGQNYHHNHYLFVLGAEWFATHGTTRLGLRLGLGAYGEYEVVETNPASPGGSNWVEAVVPGLVLARDLGGGRLLVLGLSDFVLGPFFAVLDPEEYGVEHRVRLTLGTRF